jgi:hypothetical protein
VGYFYIVLYDDIMMMSKVYITTTENIKTLVRATDFFQERAPLPPDLRKMCSTVASRPAPRNHFGSGDPINF